MTGLAHAVGLLARRYWGQATAWVVSIWIQAVISPPAYVSFYPDPDSRTVLVEQMRASMGSRVIYGWLPQPGTIGQLIQWKTGMHLVWTAALMALLLTISATRGEEQAGHTELLRANGAGKWTPFAAAALWAGGVVIVMAAGTVAVFAAFAPSNEELTVAGACSLGGVVGVVGLAGVASSLLIAQLVHDVAAGRMLALSSFGAALALRVAADENEASWLRWLSPQAWRDLVKPYEEDRWDVVAICLSACLALGAVSAVLYGHRELLAGWLPQRRATAKGLRVRGVVGLIARLGRAQAIAWLVAGVSLSGLLGSITGSLEELLEGSAATMEWMGKMTASQDLVVQSLAMLSVLLAMLALAAGVQRASALAHAEREGWLETTLAQGPRRSALYWGHCLHAVLVSGAVLLGSAGTLAAVTALQLTEKHAVTRAFVFTVSQFPGMLAGVGVALLVAGIAPRWSGVAWALVWWSVFVIYFGGLLEWPDWARDLTLLGHYLDVEGEPAWRPLAVQVALAAVGAAGGWLVFSRRDL